MGWACAYYKLDQFFSPAQTYPMSLSSVQCFLSAPYVQYGLRTQTAFVAPRWISLGHEAVKKTPSLVVTRLKFL